jgi:hypothetical protein
MFFLWISSIISYLQFPNLKKSSKNHHLFFPLKIFLIKKLGLNCKRLNVHLFYKCNQWSYDFLVLCFFYNNMLILKVWKANSEPKTRVLPSQLGGARPSVSWQWPCRPCKQACWNSEPPSYNSAEQYFMWADTGFSIQVPAGLTHTGYAAIPSKHLGL